MHSTQFWEKVFSVWLLKDVIPKHVILCMFCLQYISVLLPRVQLDHLTSEGTADNWNDYARKEWKWVNSLYINRVKILINIVSKERNLKPFKDHSKTCLFPIVLYNTRREVDFERIVYPVILGVITENNKCRSNTCGHWKKLKVIARFEPGTLRWQASSLTTTPLCSFRR